MVHLIFGRAETSKGKRKTSVTEAPLDTNGYIRARNHVFCLRNNHLLLFFKQDKNIFYLLLVVRERTLGYGSSIHGPNRFTLADPSWLSERLRLHLWRSDTYTSKRTVGSRFKICFSHPLQPFALAHHLS